MKGAVPGVRQFWKGFFPEANGRDIQARLGKNNFDGLRLVFASMVVLFHIAILSKVPQFQWMLSAFSGVLAVQCFFFVSGFLVTMSCERSSTLLSYFKKRAARIAPAYVVVVVMAAVLLSLLSSLAPKEYFLSSGVRRYLAYNLLLANFSAPALPGVFESNPDMAVNGSLWTIKIEVAFYCAVPLILWLTRRFGAVRVSAVVFLVSMVWFLGFTLAYQYLGFAMGDKLAKQLPGQLSFFMGGAWAYYRTRAGAAPPSGLLMLLAVLLHAFTNGLLHQILAPITVTLMVYWLAISLPSLGRAGKYGDFSYGIYLYHFPVIQVFIAVGLFQHSPLTSLVVILALVLMLAFVSWHFIETPFLARKMRGVEVNPSGTHPIRLSQ
jgi:peptidoglycan/LPS O-acetylase OafA/YrhL